MKIKVHWIVDGIAELDADSQEEAETWVNEELIEVKGYTDFEDEREYYIDGRDNDQNFIASGMDGELILDKNIIKSFQNGGYDSLLSVCPTHRFFWKIKSNNTIIIIYHIYTYKITKYQTY